MDVSFLPQWGRPDGGSPSAQWLVSPSVDWTIFQNDTIGTGSLQLASYLARYGTSRSAADVAGNVGLITPTERTQARSTGWSVNAAQNLNDTWAFFGRANYAYGDVNTIQGSFVLGGAINDPLKRSATDRIGLAFAYSDVAPPPIDPAGARNEQIIETYWNWIFAKGLLLTPAVQYIIDPAVNPSRDSVWVFSLRLTLML